MPEAWETITQEQIHAALADLERPFREVYELRLLENCSYDEIADKLTIPRSTVGTRLMRARTKLRQTLRAVASSGERLRTRGPGENRFRALVAVGVADDRAPGGRGRAGRARWPRGRRR